MSTLPLKAYVSYHNSMQLISNRTLQLIQDESRRDRWAVLVVISIALVLAVGLGVAWWITCQSKGMYPALDMPSFKDGGTWKAYCKR